MALTNHFAAEGLIIQRIKDKAIVGIVDVLPASSIVDDVDLSQFINHIFVEPHEGVYSPDVSDGQNQTETQSWQVTLLVKNPTGTDDSVSKVAGGYLTQILNSLVGRRLIKELTPLVISARPVPRYEQGIAQFPIILNTRLIVLGDQT